MEKIIKNKKFEPSPEQKNAAFHKGNTIVSAGAGCGKTATMLERILDKIYNGVPLTEMLIVTFTRASAADIREKLSRRFSDILAVDPDNAQIREASYAMPIADIGTLHSFCQKLIRSYFYAADIDPGRTVCDEAEATVMKYGCIRAAVRDAKLEGNREFDTLCEMLSDRRTDEGMEEAVLRVLDYALSLPPEENFFDKIRDDSEYFDEADEIVNEKRAALEREIRDFSVEVEAVGLKKLLPAVGGLSAYVNFVADKPRLPSVKKEPFGEEKAAAFTALRKKCDEFVGFKANVENAKSVNSVPYVTALMRVARDAFDRYAARKEDRGVIDYSDLEHGASRILSDKGCLGEITSGIKYVFIDEYQDVNPLQNSIAEKFKAAGSEIFLVGDVKQSIYGFRRCEPRYFNAALKNSDYTRFDLTGNYRSGREIVDFVNKVCSAAMTESVGGVDYADGRNALSAKSGENGCVDFAVIDKHAVIVKHTDGADDLDNIEESKNCGDDSAKTSADEATDSRQAEPETAELEPYSVINALPKKPEDPEVYYIANRILELTDTNRDGSAAFGDIAVLMRSTKSEFCSRLAETLGRLGIPVSIGRSAKLTDFPDAVALLDIARCVDTSMDDLALYTALRSPMGGFSDGELAEIAFGGGAALEGRRGDKRKRREPFYRKVGAYEGVYKRRLNDFFSLRDKFRTYSMCHDASDTLGYITSETDYFRHVYAMSGKGGHSAAAVEALIECAAKRKCDLHSFISYCSDPDFELSTAPIGDAVRIETIHASKGIEYDHCFVADCGRRFNFASADSDVIIDSDGVSLKIPAEDGGIVDSVPYIIAQWKTENSIRSEEMRMLYVALTRAKKTLVVTGKGKTNSAVDAVCYLDFFGGALPRCVDKVTAPVEKRRGQSATHDTADITREVRKRCSFVYPREIGTDGRLAEIDPAAEEKKAAVRSFIPIKTSVTAVAEADDNIEDRFVLADDGERGGDRVDRKRAARKDKAEGKYAGLTSSEVARLRGTAYHRAMELIDFDSPDFDEVKKELDDAELVDESSVLKAVDAMKKLTEGAAFVGKERYFIADIPIDGKFGGESVLVQGVIDLLIVDKSGNATIIDYKTTAESGLYSDGYSVQLDLYAKAVEKSTPFKVVKKLLYSFDKGFISLDK